MVRQIEPYLEGAVPVANVGIVFSERTRFRFPKYDRTPYVTAMEGIAKASLERSAPIEFVNALDLGDPKKDISRLTLLILPLTSGLTPQELAQLRSYAEKGGTLLIAGDALRHDERGVERKDFALAAEMGVSYRQPLASESVTPPLLHINDCGKGRIAYLPSLNSPEVTQRAIASLAGAAPLRMDEPQQALALLTRQPVKKRWILHLISDGDCTVTLSQAQVPVSKVTAQFPTGGWTYRAEPATNGLRISVSGREKDRLLVLE